MTNQEISVNLTLTNLYDIAYKRGYEKAIEDLHDIKKRMEEMVDFLNTKENK